MDHPQDDRSLLTHYAATRSADAFNAIVQRHAGMVYASAKRQVRRSDLAEEVTQAVFILLYRKAHTLDERTVLAAWLFRTTRYAAKNALRAERRREHHERKAAFRTEPMRTNDAMWQDVHPVLDEAIAKLSDADRDVIVLRYLEQRSYADVSRALRISIEAAQMRAKRAIDKLRDILRRRGITITATALGGLVMSRSADAAPASVVQSIAHATTGSIEAPTDYPLADETARALWWDAIRGQAVVAGVAVALTVLCCVSLERAIVRVGEWYRTPRPIHTPSTAMPEHVAPLQEPVVGVSLQRVALGGRRPHPKPLPCVHGRGGQRSRPRRRSAPKGFEFMPINHDIPTLVDAMIADAVRDRASDIHVEPGPAETRVRFRVDGLLVDHASHDNTTGRGIVNRLMVMAQLLTYRLDVPQEGRATYPHHTKPLDLRIAIMPTTHGLRAAVRLPADLTQPKSLDALSLDPRTSRLIEHYIRSDAGALLIVGPAGSGKTTAAYAILEAIRDRSPGTSIVTLEDPVERQLPGITQIPVTPFGQLTYATALRSMLRQDPQVLMLGEIRDTDTASIAMQAALSGHRMLCTFHASDPAAAIMRLIEMGVEPYQVASSVAGVVSMRLLRRRSSDGYSGRVAVCESVAVDDAMRAVLRREVDAAAIRRVYSSHTDHRTLANAATDLVTAGVTDEAEVARVVGTSEKGGQ